jgi:Xanthomonas XOO_2897-like deaminase
MGDRKRMSLLRFLLLYGGALVVTVTLLGGLLIYATLRTPPPDAPERVPFDSALIALAAAPELHYRSNVPSIGLVDARVTSNDEAVGTLSAGGKSYGLLRAGGKFYVKLPATGLPNASNAAVAAATRDRWLTGRDVTSLLGPIPSQLESPPQLAARLADALSQASGFPPLNDSGTVFDGVRVVDVTTSLGDLFVTRDAPHRIVRLTPRFGSSSVGLLADPAFAESAPPEGGVNFPSEQPGDIGRTYNTLIQDTRALATASDSNLRFNLQGNGQISCGDGGCQVSVTVTNSASAPGSKVVGGAVRAVLTAAISIEGQPADGCTGAGSLPLNGTGTLACPDPGAGALFASVEARKKAAAEAQSQAQNGAPVPYSVTYSGEYVVYAAAQVDVEQLVKAQMQEASGAARQATCAAGIAAVDGPTVLDATASCDDFGGAVRYRSTTLSEAAYQARIRNGFYDADHNVAVARVKGWNDPKTGDLVYGFSKGNGAHAEQEILGQLEKRGFQPSAIEALYTERQPCPGKCRPLLYEQLDSGTPVSWTVPWSDNRTLNAAYKQLLLDEINGVRVIGSR